jgi:GH25 family lysozyme M1 (1,4-beta-N-acetylmuramidase)
LSVYGCDISDNNPPVASFHDALAAGRGFCICKATQGTYNTQATLPDYLNRIRSIGMIAGAYHFMDWSNDPAAQVAHFLSVYTPANGDLAPMLDAEAFTLGKAETTAMMQAWLDAIQPHLKGKLPLVYASYGAVGVNFDPSGFEGHPFVIAAYNELPFTENIPPGLSKVVMHQYSDQAQVPGIGSCDGDVFNGDEAALKALCMSGL